MSEIPSASAIDDIAYFAKRIARSRLRLETQLAAGLSDDHPTVLTERKIANRGMDRLRLLLESAVVSGDLHSAREVADRLAAADGIIEEEETEETAALSVMAIAAVMEAAALAGGE